MEQIHGFDYFPLNFDEKGTLTQSGQLEVLKQRASTATDVIFLAHGFRNNVNDATALYTNFLNNFRGHFSRPECTNFATRNFIAAGVFWPSKALPESFPAPSEGSVESADEDAPVLAGLAQKIQDLKSIAPEHSAELDRAMALLPQLKNEGAAQDKFTSLILTLTDDSQLDATEGLQQVREQNGSTILQKLSAPIILPTQAGDSNSDADNSGGALSVDDLGNVATDGGVQSIGSFFGSVLGGVDTFLNLTTWYVMKNRSGVVGATGVAQAVRDIKATNPRIKVHLVGHSLGGRLMAACAKALAQDPLLQPDSLTLLEAAFSHYGFSANNGQGTSGFFRDVIAKKVVKGPFLATFSAQDGTVGLDYAVSSRLSDDNTKAVGDANDKFGGIGRNGAQKTAESVIIKLKAAGALDAPYAFQTDIVTCLDGSGGLIKNHGDITNESVTYAFACSVAATMPAANASGGSH